jgi:hypothetical protein
MCKYSSRMALEGERSRAPVHNIARIAAVLMNDQPDDVMRKMISDRGNRRECTACWNSRC